jgi:cyanophycin synthetase
MGPNILTVMPPEPAQRPADVELVELRVLDGPNRFFTRPAVKLEFIGVEPGQAAEVAASAALAVRRLSSALDLPEPRLTTRHSVDGLRTALAYPWRRRTISQAIGAAAARLALGRSSERREVAGLRATALGPLPHLPKPRIPIVAITGTNGKSTTTRLIAHIATEAGRKVGMTNSDGIYVRGELVEAGDWTGFGGAARVLAEPGLQLAVLETARGGILLRGIGYAANDVSVVTNVSADHLGLQGIDTEDELAEVKGTIVRITKRDGWAVLNADDDRVWALHRQTRAGLYAFSLDPDSGRVEEALDRGGRAAVFDDGILVLRRAGGRPRRLAAAAELPVTVAGLSRYNIANALAAAAACDALGIAAPRIARGLRSFAQDSAANPGRLNLYERRGTFVVIDFAHNEAGLTGLIDVAKAISGRHAVRLAIGTAGDRTDEIIHRLGMLAGRADDVVIAEKPHYLRGRTLEGMNELMRAGAREGGYAGEVEAHSTELAALRALLGRARRGDVCAVMAHVERSELFDWLSAEGFMPVGVQRLRELTARH